MKIVVGNKNYSSWSLRPWLTAKVLGIPFDEVFMPFSGPNWQEKYRLLSPTGRVPVLIDGNLRIAESLAIIEYLADKFPEKGVWPADILDRAVARSLSAEIHAGFLAIRGAAPMNLRASHPDRVDLAAVEGDLKRFEKILAERLKASGGPFMFGPFTAVDAMYAPLATRLETYELPVSPAMREYMTLIFALPAFKEWKMAALREPWIVETDEIDFIQKKAAEAKAAMAQPAEAKAAPAPQP